MPRRPAKITQDAEATTADVRSAIEYMLYVVDNYGDRYMPILDALINDLEEIERREGPRERARRMLAAHTLDGGLKAIR